MKKPKYKIGDCLYYFDTSKNEIVLLEVYKIIITEMSINYANKYDTVVVSEEYLKPTIKRLIQKVLGKEYAYARVFELLIKKESKDE